MKAVKNVLTSYVNYVMFMLNSNEPNRVACYCLDQISGRREFVLNLLQKGSIAASFW